MATTITFTATLPSGEAVTRTSGTMAYTHSVGGVTWHKSYQGAMKQHQANAYGPIVEVVATKVNGKVDATDRDFYAAAETAWSPAQRQAILDLIDAKLAPKAPSKAKKRSVSEDAVAFATTVAEIAAEDEAVTPAEVETIPALPEPIEVTEVAPAKKITRKQALGDQIHALIHAALADDTIVLPEGLGYPEAREAVAKWLQHVPSSANPGGRTARPGDAARKAK